MLLLALALAAQTDGKPATTATRPPVAPRQVAARATLDDGTAVELLIIGDAATLVVDGRTMAIRTVDQALMLLADERARPLWPVLLDWAGPTMERLRARQLAAARAAIGRTGTDVATSAAASTVRPRARAVMLEAEALAATGQLDAALAMVERARDEITGHDEWSAAEYAILALRAATYRRYRGGVEAQIAALRAGEAHLGATPYTLNLSMTRAAVLANTGRYAEALALVDAGQAAFEAKGADPDLRVPGSDRQFAWIRICALNGLGRRDEARALMTRLYPPVEPAHDQFILSSSETLRYQLSRCTGDAAEAARELAKNGVGVIGGAALLELQPALRTPARDPALMRRIAADPAMVTALRGRFRVLPPELIPALNHWR